MFLYNMLVGQPKQQVTKYDKITFKINLSDNIPQFFQCSSDKVEEEEYFTPNHPLYYKLFPQQNNQNSQDHQNYIQYQVLQNDTISGLSIKLDIRQKQIRQINGISGNIYPGMFIKLPENVDISKLKQGPTQQLNKLKISELLLNNQLSNNQNTFKFKVSYYAGLAGYIKGTLTMNSNYIIFNPNLQDQQNLSKFSVQKLLKFNALVETADIQDAMYMSIPEMTSQIGSQEVPKINHVIQIYLYSVGNPRIQKKYKQRLKQLKIDHKAIASISFSLKQYGQKAKAQCQNMVKLIKQMIQKNQIKQKQQKSHQKKKLTNIPFFDILHQNIHPKMKQNLEQESLQNQTHIIHPSTVLGCLNENSDIINDNQFQNLAIKLPILYQLCNWVRIYSSTKNGTSFHTFLNKAKDQYPILMLVKQYKGYKFGSFLVDSIETGKTGKGEMFIFTFKDGQIPDVFKWTTKNQFFVYVQKDSGIGIGMGVKYGLFLKNTMDKGSSSSTLTFGNDESLSKKQDFLVDEVELWTVDMSL